MHSFSYMTIYNISLFLQLKRKTAELMAASQKHYELEQELAFYKIDHKFGALSQPPRMPTPDSGEVLER